MGYDYNYDSAEVTTIDGVPEESVLTLLFEGTAASGSPAADEKLNYIENAAGDDLGTIEVLSVDVVKEDDKHLVFRVRIDNTDVTAPAGMPENGTRVLHEQDIPYKHYRVAIVN